MPLPKPPGSRPLPMPLRASAPVAKSALEKSRSCGEKVTAETASAMMMEGVTAALGETEEESSCVTGFSESTSESCASGT